uniref:Glutamine amidotransferase type-2 domain-containing protein n=1 Tax=Sinocyclocheilus grahami TaxID=75366 RepID=A0A672QU87_SINGR
MCGICCVVSLTTPHNPLDKHVHENLKHRGPNSSHDITETISNCSLLFSAHVLHMRGCLTPQPLQDDNGNMLLWNGEVFGGLRVDQGENDTKVVLHHLSMAQCASDMLSLLSQLKGPWASAWTQCVISAHVWNKITVKNAIPYTWTDMKQRLCNAAQMLEIPSSVILDIPLQSCSITCS